MTLETRSLPLIQARAHARHGLLQIRVGQIISPGIRAVVAVDTAPEDTHGVDAALLIEARIEGPRLPSLCVFEFHRGSWIVLYWTLRE